MWNWFKRTILRRRVPSEYRPYKEGRISRMRDRSALPSRHYGLLSRTRDRIAEAWDKVRPSRRPRRLIPWALAFLFVFIAGGWLGNWTGDDPSRTTKVVKHYVTVPDPDGPGYITIPVTKDVTKYKYKNRLITVRLTDQGKAAITIGTSTVYQTAPGSTVVKTSTDTKTDTSIKSTTVVDTTTNTVTKTVVSSTTIPGTTDTVRVTTTTTEPASTVTETTTETTTVTATT